MGTRSLVCVTVPAGPEDTPDASRGERDDLIKIAQFVQWDGYPAGQGEACCAFIQGADLEAFQESVREVKFVDDEEVAARWKEIDPRAGEWVSIEVSEKFEARYPQFHRNTGARILPLVVEGCREVVDDRIFAANGLFCEWAYVLDLGRGVLEIHEGFQKEPHRVGRFSALPLDEETHKGEQYYPARLVAEVPFTEIKKEGVLALARRFPKDFPRLVDEQGNPLPQEPQEPPRGSRRGRRVSLSFKTF